MFIEEKKVEEFEYSIRNNIEEIYIKKTKEILDKARIGNNLGNQSLEQSNKLKEIISDQKIK